MKDRLQKIRNEAIAQIKAAGGMDALNDIRVSFLGKKGELTAIMKSMRDIPPEERPAFGQMVNEARQEIENSLDTMKKDLAAKAENFSSNPKSSMLHFRQRRTIWVTATQTALPRKKLNVSLQVWVMKL